MENDLPESADLAVRLHTAARRYCIERHEHWVSKYTDLQRGREFRIPYTYSDKDLDTFPRYNVVRAILLNVERIAPSNYGLEELRIVLARAGNMAHTKVTLSPQGLISETAMDEERSAFEQFVLSVDEVSLRRVAPLPCRRVVSDEEATELRGRLVRAWEASRDSYWYPLTETQRPDVLAFQRERFDSDQGSKKLRTILRNRGITKVFQDEEEDKIIYEIETGQLDVAKSNEEIFWYTSKMDWIVYLSHEASVAVGGSLVQPLQNAWPNWEASLYC